jgi:hypothetical protein
MNWRKWHNSEVAIQVIVEQKKEHIRMAVIFLGDPDL